MDSWSETEKGVEWPDYVGVPHCILETERINYVCQLANRLMDSVAT